MAKKDMSLSEARERVGKLKIAIEKYRRAYHVDDTSLVSDAVNDSLKKELFDLETLYPELVTPDSPTQRIGGEPLQEFAKVRHDAPMLSFNDAFSEEDMRAWFERLGNYLGREVVPEFYCELKIDGLAIELVYENGALVQGSTRGDGRMGEDVTQNLKTIEAIPLRVAGAPRRLVVRGEVFLAKKEFARINKEQKKKGEKIYANPRNVAAGAVRQLDSKIVASRKLDSFMYDVVTDVGVRTHEEAHTKLKKFGFKTNPHNKRVGSLDETFRFRDKWEKEKDTLDYEVDGVVVAVNDTTTLTDAGVVGKAPRGAIAYKFAPEEATTRVREIHVQVGRTGVLTPVAVMDPVAVGGVTVTHATLHNFDEITRLDVKIGDTVVVSRAGDVIPKITGVLVNLRTGDEKAFRMPRVCPVDGSKVVREGALYKCSNTRCGAQERERLRHFVSRGALDIRGLGGKIIDRFVDEGLVSDGADIFTVQEGDISVLPRFGAKSAENIVIEVEEKRRVALPRLLYALGILHVGEETAVVLAERFPVPTIADLVRVYSGLSREQLEAVPDVGPKVAESIYNWFHDDLNVQLLRKLERAGVTIVSSPTRGKGGAFSGKVFVFTGSLESLSRDRAKELVGKCVFWCFEKN
jgi:DNA ligase (NAD+)